MSALTQRQMEPLQWRVLHAGFIKSVCVFFVRRKSRRVARRRSFQSWMCRLPWSVLVRNVLTLLSWTVTTHVVTNLVSDLPRMRVGSACPEHRSIQVWTSTSRAGLHVHLESGCRFRLDQDLPYTRADHSPGKKESHFDQPSIKKCWIVDRRVSILEQNLHQVELQ